MIQRIQTVYLLITILLTSLVIGFPVMADGASDPITYKVTVLGMYYENGNMAYSTWILLAICIVNILVALATIMQFKNRKLQMRLATFNVVFTAGFYVALGGYYWMLLSGKFSTEIAFNWTVVLPAINIILIYLSIRAIGRDEALVKATDRLR